MAAVDILLVPVLWWVQAHQRVIIWVPGPQLPVDKVQATCPKAKFSPTGMRPCHALGSASWGWHEMTSPKKKHGWIFLLGIENCSKKQLKPFWHKPIILLKYISIRLLKYFNKTWISIIVAKINNFFGVFNKAYSGRQFSAHLTKCHACHGICTLSPLDAAVPMRFAKSTQQDTSEVLRLPRQMTMDTSKVLRLPRKLQRIFWKRRKNIAPATQNDFRHVTKNVWMSRSATPATRNEATTHWKPPKMTTSAELTRGTAIRSSYGRLRTVANGCERLRT